MTNKSNKFKFTLILSLLNVPFSLYALYLYAPSFEMITGGGIESVNTISINFKTLIYYLFAGISHFYLYFFLVNLLLIYPALFALKRNKILFSYILLINFLAQIVLLIDAHLFYLYRFHLSFAMLDLFFNAGSEVISLSASTWISIILQISLAIGFACVAVALAFWIAKRQVRGFGIAFCAFVAIYLGANLTHAYAFAKQKFEIIVVANHLPIYKPLTANKFLLKIGAISEDEIKNNNFKIAQRGIFNYPKEPLRYKDKIPQYNVLLLLSDSLRFDMLNPTNMPFTYEFAKGASVFANHYASSNSTRGGIFGLFYGLPPSYWQIALGSGKGAALIEAMQKWEYEIGIFTSAGLERPEFHQTIFAQVANLRIDSKGNNAIERDRDAIDDFKKFIATKDKNKPFFSFIFLDNIHGYAIPQDFKAKFTPYGGINHLSLNKDSDSREYFNLYQNAVLHTDDNFRTIIEALKARGEFENTIIIISSDHGEEFNEDRDNYWGHNNNFKDYQLKIPLVIKWANQRKSEVIHTKTSAYDISATLMQEVFGVANEIRDYSIGQNLRNLYPRPYVLAGSYNENAIIEDERIIIIDVLGMMHFKDKKYKNSTDRSRKSVVEPYKIFFEYLK